MATPSKTQKTAAASASDDFEIVDAGTTGTATSQLPAVAEDAPKTPAVYTDDFDNELPPAHVPAPTLTLVHGVGDYKNNHNPGQFVVGSLERAAELTLGATNKYKTPEDLRTKARFKVIVVAVSVPTYQPDVKPDHPAFRLEVPTEAGNGHLQKIADMGGTIDRKLAMPNGRLQLFVPKSEVTLLIEMPAHVSPEMADMFPFTLDGKQYTMAKYYAKKSAFTNFVETLRGQKRVNPSIMDKKNSDGTVLRGRWYGASFLLGTKLVTTTANPSGFYVPEVVPCPDKVGPEAYAFAQDADPVKRS